MAAQELQLKKYKAKLKMLSAGEGNQGQQRGNSYNRNPNHTNS